MRRTDGYEGSDIKIFGGDFMCRSARGGFLGVGDNSSVKITGGLISNNEAGRRAGAVSPSV